MNVHPSANILRSAPHVCSHIFCHTPPSYQCSPRIGTITSSVLTSFKLYMLFKGAYSRKPLYAGATPAAIWSGVCQKFVTWSYTFVSSFVHDNKTPAQPIIIN